MPRARAIQVRSPNGPFELVEREIPNPGARQVRIQVEACGICHSDSTLNAPSASTRSWPPPTPPSGSLLWRSLVPPESASGD